MDGVGTAANFQQKGIPVIFLTANSDEATFNRAKLTKPAALGKGGTVNGTGFGGQLISLLTQQLGGR